MRNGWIRYIILTGLLFAVLCPRLSFTPMVPSPESTRTVWMLPAIRSGPLTPWARSNRTISLLVNAALEVRLFDGRYAIDKSSVPIGLCALLCTGSKTAAARYRRKS